MAEVLKDGRVAAQPVLTPLTSAAVFLILTVDVGGEQVARDVLADCAGLCRSVGFRTPDGRLACVAGIGSQAWDRLFAGARPKELHPFRELHSARHHAVSTAGDLMFHIRARQMDLCFELAAKLVDRVRGAATVVDEVHGFKYFDERDLLGFVDGTENPVGAAAHDAVTVGDADPPFLGSSYVIVQKYVHDMDAWNALTVEEQERAFGRTKVDDIEMADDVKPGNSNLALNVVEGDDGLEIKILRDNMPFGRVGTGEFGTYYIAYAKSPSSIERMLSNMFIGHPPGNTDRILDFSTPLTGCLFFVPTQSSLDDLPAAPS